MARWSSWAQVLLTCALLGCGGDPAPGKGAADPASSLPTKTPDPWRFRPTLEQHLPAKAVAEPVMELSLPTKRTVILLAAVLRQGSTDVGIERWTFEQIPGQETVTLSEGGEQLLRLRPGPRHPQLGDLRRNLATPRAILNRPLGLEDTPKTTIERLRTAFATLRDPGGDARARVRAAATVIRGLDDSVVLERDGIWEVDAILLAEPQTLEVEAISERRARATLTLPEGTAKLELQRKTEGWAISSYEAPPPPEPEPEPTAGGSTSGTVEL